MLIRSLTLENFGLFRGRNEFDLAPKAKYGRTRPVVLIGGKNGAGKTTLLEAVRLCLYGPQALGGRGTSRQYEAHLRGRIHRDDDALLRPQSASVGLEFEHAELGERHVYRIERSWDALETGVQTYLTVQRDGQPLDGIDQAHADEFLRDLIPPGVSQLYFFDGEKIQHLAESEHDDIALGDAVRALLGLDLVERLGGDLRIYASRIQDSPGADPIKAELAQISEEQRILEQRRLESQRKLDESQSRLDSLGQSLSRLERQISKEGGAFASQREALKAEKEQLLRATAEAEDELRQLAEGLLPFMFAGPWCQRLGDQLLAEEKLQGWQTHESLLAERIGKVKASLGDILPATGATPDPQTHTRLVKRVSEILDGLLEPPDHLPEIAMIHRLSDAQRQRLLRAIDQIQNDTPRQLGATHSRLEEATRRLRDVETALGKVPAEDQLQPLLERLHELHCDLAAAGAEAERCAQDLKTIDSSAEELKRRARKLEERLVDAERGLDRRAMVTKVRAVLDDYAAGLTAAKAKDLGEAVASRFAQLWRKGDVVRRIEIDATTFEVTLFDRHNRSVPKKQLSAGEKQIYAISLLWGLAQVSGRPLPMVIDTPLGRLDSDHRGHLVQRYFAQASHQVIILSTDTEIDKTYFRDLSPEVSHAYHLRYDPYEARTLVEEGYFWSRREVELTHAD